ncbi:MAG: hemerythrin domain-containing protein [Acidimicrobiia bacterium]|nr:hemerythrin domain-containing protein [Acidimicrobiia bacterium]
MVTTTELNTRAATPDGDPGEAARDDLLVLIHKALRYGLFQVVIEAGATDWTDAGSVAVLRVRWDTVEHLIHTHAGHEDRHIFALLETKQPGSVGRLGIGHTVVEHDLDRASAAMHKAFDARTPQAGLTAYRVLNSFVATAMSHFADEEPAVMEEIWSTCTDEEIAACRAAFMAEITPDDAISTYELMFPAVPVAELAELLGTVQAAAPAPLFDSLLDVAERTLTPSAWKRLRNRLDR